MLRVGELPCPLLSPTSGQDAGFLRFLPSCPIGPHHSCERLGGISHPNMCLPWTFIWTPGFLIDLRFFLCHVIYWLISIATLLSLDYLNFAPAVLQMLSQDIIFPPKEGTVDLSQTKEAVFEL